ncbi:MAG: hypothetical protein ACOYOA_03445 [Saprospiraceae bacterium]
MKLELLEKLQKVDAPSYLLTRINEQIRSQQQMFNLKWVWAISMVCCLVFVLDFSLLIRTKTDSTQESNLNESFHINPHNQLYSR